MSPGAPAVRRGVLLAAVFVLSGVVPHDGWAAAPEGRSYLRQPLIAWGVLTQDLISDAGQDAAMASRTFALVAYAQYRAVQEVGSSDDPENRVVPQAGYAGLVAGGSAGVLTEIFPGDPQVDEALSELIGEASALGRPAGEIEATIARGRAYAAEALQLEIGMEGSGLKVEADVSGKTTWRSLENRPPIRPGWGNLKPLVIEETDLLIAPPPPDVNGPEIVRALEEVRRLSADLEDDETTIVRHWADAVGTAGPAGHWNSIAWRLIERDGVGTEDAAEILFDLNVALFDAGIACWRTKYWYMYPRPSQLDPRIVPGLHVPNFPSYVSGHSTFSAAASTVLGYHFPEEAERLEGQAAEASRSRLLAGLHYRFDCDEGLRLGRKIGEAVIALRIRAAERGV